MRLVAAKTRTVNATVGGSVTSCIFATRLQSLSDSYGMAKDLNGNYTLLSSKVAVAGNQASATAVLVHHLVVAGTARIDGQERGIESEVCLSLGLSIIWLHFVL